MNRNWSVARMRNRTRGGLALAGGLCAALCTTLAALPAQAAPSLQLTPGGAISGAPGSTVGWGFILTNDADYLVVNSATFPASVTIGIFTDYTGANFVVVGPAPESATVSQAFDPILMTGVGAFAIDTFAPLGSVATGLLTLNYALYSVSPNDANFNPDTDLISSSNDLTAEASVTVVPTPAPLVLVAAGLIGLGQRGSARRRTGAAERA